MHYDCMFETKINILPEIHVSNLEWINLFVKSGSLKCVGDDKEPLYCAGAEGGGQWGGD